MLPPAPDAVGLWNGPYTTAANGRSPSFHSYQPSSGPATGRRSSSEGRSRAVEQRQLAGGTLIGMYRR
ncbi:hypothetical protein [Streptomyces sp. NPDC053079]|uniref:hypothetical protein n=1 Tax=Streptomyces sp. NPDC053079 TaxID=3365697 RepID=UPI0037CD41C1